MQAHMASTTPYAALEYRPDIDGLRAFAVVSVVLFHIFPGRLTGGFVGVDVFFVISGYLITGIIYKAMLNERFSIAEFYARRVRRICPALGAMLLAVLIFGYWALFDDEYAQIGLHVFGGASFSSNFILAAEAGYFDTAAENKPLLHLWSLGVEEQFYILWPLLIWATFKAHRRMRSVLWSVLLVSFLLNLAYIRQYPENVFFWPFTRVWELAIGGVIAVAVQQRPAAATISLRQANILAGLGGACLLAASILLDRSMAFPGAWALLPTVGAALLIYTGCQPTWVSRILGVRPVVFVGLISYSLYLWHWPVFVFAKHLIAEQLPMSAKVGVIVISVVLACLTYWFIETPLRHPGQRGRQKVIGLSAGIALLGLTGSWLWHQNGLPQRGAAFQNQDAGRRWPANTDRGYTATALAQSLFAGQFTKDRDFFLVPRTPRKQQVVVIGDSHANRLAVALGVTEANVDKVLNLGRGTCLPLYGSDLYLNGKSLQCQPLMKNIIDHVATSHEIGTVVLSGYFNHYLNARHGAPLLSEEAFEASLVKTLARLIDAGKQTIVVADVPEITIPVAECAARPLKLHPVRANCSIPAEQHRKDSAIARRVIERMKARFPTLVVVEPERFFCDDSICNARRDGRLVYMSDGNHMTYEGARQLGEWMMERTSALGNLRAGLVSTTQSRSGEQR